MNVSLLPAAALSSVVIFNIRWIGFSAWVKSETETRGETWQNYLMVYGKKSCCFNAPSEKNIWNILIQLKTTFVLNVSQRCWANPGSFLSVVLKVLTFHLCSDWIFQRLCVCCSDFTTRLFLKEEASYAEEMI